MGDHIPPLRRSFARETTRHVSTEKFLDELLINVFCTTIPGPLIMIALRTAATWICSDCFILPRQRATKSWNGYHQDNNRRIISNRDFFSMVQCVPIYSHITISAPAQAYLVLDASAIMPNSSFQTIAFEGLFDVVFWA